MLSIFGPSENICMHADVISGLPKNVNMKLKLYQVDAFADQVFSGNPAAVCPLEDWPEDALLQNIAMENNLPETAFFAKQGDEYEIRWFTPTVEVDLCGHATLASAHVLFNFYGYAGAEIRFHSPRSGLLKVRKNGDLLTLDFPADDIRRVEPFPGLTEAFGTPPAEVWKGKTDYMLVFENEEQIKTMQPDLQAVSRLDARGVIVTARGGEVDFVSRFFGPQSGIDEDPATGSAHTTLTPYWAEKLGKNALSATQLSARKGTFRCKRLNGRVEISGQARTYLTGEINLG